MYIPNYFLMMNHRTILLSTVFPFLIMLCLISYSFSLADIYKMVLTIYEADHNFPKATRNEVLVCHRKTRAGEV